MRPDRAMAAPNPDTAAPELPCAPRYGPLKT